MHRLQASTTIPAWRHEQEHQHEQEHEQEPEHEHERQHEQQHEDEEEHEQKPALRHQECRLVQIPKACLRSFISRKRWSGSVGEGSKSKCS